MCGVAEELASRAASARWKWKAERARTAITAAFESRDQHLAGEWCGFEESTGLGERVERLGPSPGRIIQRWPAKRQFVAALQACGSAAFPSVDVHVVVMDAPDAGWIRVRADLVAGDLARAVGEWMTDGFIAFDPEVDSLLSVDVEEKGGVSFIETTLIGAGFGELRAWLGKRGPSPLVVVEQGRRP